MAVKAYQRRDKDSDTTGMQSSIVIHKDQHYMGPSCKTFERSRNEDVSHLHPARRPPVNHKGHINMATNNHDTFEAHSNNREDENSSFAYPSKVVTKVEALKDRIHRLELVGSLKDTAPNQRRLKSSSFDDEEKVRRNIARIEESEQVFNRLIRKDVLRVPKVADGNNVFSRNNDSQTALIDLDSIVIDKHDCDRAVKTHVAIKPECDLVVKSHVQGESLVIETAAQNVAENYQGSTKPSVETNCPGDCAPNIKKMIEPLDSQPMINYDTIKGLPSPILPLGATSEPPHGQGCVKYIELITEPDLNDLNGLTQLINLDSEEIQVSFQPKIGPTLTRKPPPPLSVTASPKSVRRVQVDKRETSQAGIASSSHPVATYNVSSSETRHLISSQQEIHPAQRSQSHMLSTYSSRKARLKAHLRKEFRTHQWSVWKDWAYDQSERIEERLRNRRLRHLRRRTLVQKLQDIVEYTGNRID